MDLPTLSDHDLAALTKQVEAERLKRQAVADDASYKRNTDYWNSLYGFQDTLLKLSATGHGYCAYEGIFSRWFARSLCVRLVIQTINLAKHRPETITVGAVLLCEQPWVICVDDGYIDCTLLTRSTHYSMPFVVRESNYIFESTEEFKQVTENIAWMQK